MDYNPIHYFFSYHRRKQEFHYYIWERYVVKWFWIVMTRITRVLEYAANGENSLLVRYIPYKRGHMIVPRQGCKWALGLLGQAYRYYNYPPARRLY